METVRVQLKADSYSIYIGQNLLPHLGEVLRPFSLSKKALLVTDPQINELHGQGVLEALSESGFTPLLFLVPPGEENKSLKWASRLYDFLMEARADRRSPIFALGGGLIGDLAGFVASTYMRGVPLVQLPTTLLAQVDSSIGGKVAVNHGQLKNKIGAFYQTRLVIGVN